MFYRSVEGVVFGGLDDAASIGTLNQVACRVIGVVECASVLGMFLHNFAKGVGVVDSVNAVCISYLGKLAERVMLLLCFTVCRIDDTDQSVKRVKLLRGNALKRVCSFFQVAVGVVGKFGGLILTADAFMQAI